MDVATRRSAGRFAPRADIHCRPGTRHLAAFLTSAFRPVARNGCRRRRAKRGHRGLFAALKTNSGVQGRHAPPAVAAIRRLSADQDGDIALDDLGLNLGIEVDVLAVGLDGDREGVASLVVAMEDLEGPSFQLTLLKPQRKRSTRRSQTFARRGSPSSASSAHRLFYRVRRGRRLGASSRTPGRACTAIRAAWTSSFLNAARPGVPLESPASR